MNNYGENPPFRAYKAFNKDLTCRGKQYKEGEIYEYSDSPILCEHGFHFCKDLVLTLEYYPADKITDNKYAEVEILGEVVFEEPTKHKGATNKIKIIRVIEDSEIKKLVDKNSNSGYYNSGTRNSGDRNSGYCNSGDSNSGYRNSGYCNSGNYNSGYCNSGNYNSRDRNSGNYNSGNCNSGDRNSGYCNSGNYNSGYRNSGDRNSGDRNSGNYNSGYCNSGDSNSGNWNSCDRESGFFNSKPIEEIRIFNKPCNKEKWAKAYKPSFLFFEIDETIGYKKSFQKSWDASDPDDRMRVKELPNFDAQVFFEISGIDLREKE